jgi:hypothetical protein
MAKWNNFYLKIYLKLGDRELIKIKKIGQELDFWEKS